MNLQRSRANGRMNNGPSRCQSQAVLPVDERDLVYVLSFSAHICTTTNYGKFVEKTQSHACVAGESAAFNNSSRGSRSCKWTLTPNSRARATSENNSYEQVGRCWDASTSAFPEGCVAMSIWPCYGCRPSRTGSEKSTAQRYPTPAQFTHCCELSGFILWCA